MNSLSMVPSIVKLLVLRWEVDLALATLACWSCRVCKVCRVYKVVYDIFLSSLGYVCRGMYVRCCMYIGYVRYVEYLKFFDHFR